MADLENGREITTPKGWRKWFLLFVAIGILAVAVLQAAMPGRQVGAIASVWISMMVLFQAFTFHDRGSREELFHEVETLRRELEQLKSSR